MEEKRSYSGHRKGLWDIESNKRDRGSIQKIHFSYKRTTIQTMLRKYKRGNHKRKSSLHFPNEEEREVFIIWRNDKRHTTKYLLVRYQDLKDQKISKSSLRGNIKHNHLPMKKLRSERYQTPYGPQESGIASHVLKENNLESKIYIWHIINYQSSVKTKEKCFCNMQKWGNFNTVYLPFKKYIWRNSAEKKYSE